MLELTDITFQTGKGEKLQRLLNEVSLRIPIGHFGAIIGPSGCGKSTLLKIVAGVFEPSEGNVCWQEQDLEEEDLAPSEIGYVPQFSIAYDYLNVWESIEGCMQLRVSAFTREDRRQRIQDILRQVGLEEIAERQVRVLSGGQKRRLALAMELVSSPTILLCDEVTSGLDPKAEDEIVTLMHRLSKEQNRIVLSVTHSLRHLPLYDSVLVLDQGCVAYHGPHSSLLSYFETDSPEKIFPRLTTKTPEEWHRTWLKRHHVYDSSKLVIDSDAEKEKAHLKEEALHQALCHEQVDLPDFFTQFSVLFRRRCKIFVRDGKQVWLQIALILGFPMLVVIFAYHGLPDIKNLDLTHDPNVVRSLQEGKDFIQQSARVGGLVSGLVMFQVILLTLMGSNNSAREIASERLIFEKEKLAGLRTTSYLASKACFLFLIVALQSVWMTVFVRVVCQFPGDLLTQMALLIAVNAAMTATCLGISSLTSSPEQASLVSIYLVGFQLPLSGAVLALPGILAVMTKSFIAAYWSWSGVLKTMQATRFYDVVQMITQTELSAVPLCFWALGSHLFLGLFLAYIGCKKSRWE